MTERGEVEVVAEEDLVDGMTGEERRQVDERHPQRVEARSHEPRRQVVVEVLRDGAALEGFDALARGIL